MAQGDAGDDGLKGRGEAEAIGKYISAESKRDGEEDVDLMGVDAANELRDDPCGSDAGGNGAAGFEQQEASDVERSRRWPWATSSKVRKKTAPRPSLKSDSRASCD